MPVDDRTRLNMQRKLEAVLGHDDADTLMAHLPPVTWREVATTDDLEALRINLANELRADFSHAMERQIRWMITFNTALAAAILAATRLLF